MSNQEPGGKRSGKIFTAIMLFMFLVGLPIGSYIYLKKGYDYQKAAMRDLRKEHRMNTPPALTMLDGTTQFAYDDYYHLIGLVPSAMEKEPYEKVLRQLHEQFDAPKNLMIWSVFENADQASLQQFKENAQLPKDTSQLLFWTATPPAFDRFVDDLQLQQEELQALDSGLIVLVDDSLYVRKAFAFTEEGVLPQLVERTAILLPERAKPKPELRRKEEF